MSSIPSSVPPQTQSGQMPPDSSSREPNPPLSWEGDRMFNIYIYDYCYKRGFRQTAQKLMVEADLINDAAPPINARQGLLFEWWSVFWVLFQAKSGNSNHEDALLYIQHQNAQKRLQSASAQQQPGVPLSNQPPQAPSNPQSQPQAPIRGIANGMSLQRQPSSYHTNGILPNGINPAMGGQPAQPGQLQQPMQGQPGATLNFGGIGGQPNGIAGAQPPPAPQGGPQQPGPQTMSFNPMMSGPATQRPPMNGHPQQPGQQQPRGPFTSPPMAHSPQGGAGGQPTTQGPAGQPGPPAPMAQLGPSPQMTPMSRSMMPGMNLPAPQQGVPPNTTFNPGPPQGPQGPQGPNPAARPPSRSRPTPSPSMSARQPAGAAGMQHQGGMGMMMQMGHMQGMPPMGGGMNLGSMAGGVGGNLNPDTIHQEFMSIPNMALTGLKQECGFGDKDLNMGDKALLVNVWKQRGGGGLHQARRDTLPGSGPGMLPPGQPQMPHQGLQIQQRPQQPQQSGSTNRLKRSSISPSDEKEPRNESSPPDRKRMKRSPAVQPAVPPGYQQHVQPSQSNSVQQPAQTPQQIPLSLNPQSGQQGPGGTPQGMSQQAQIMMMRQMGVPGATGHVPGGPTGQGKGGAAQPPTGHQAVGMPMHPGQMHHPQQAGLFRGGPPAARPHFHPTPLTQLATKPHTANSSGINGPSKDGNKDVKPSQSNGQPQPGNQPGPDASPRGTAPPTPGGSSQPTPGLPPPSVPPGPAPGPGGTSARTPTPQQQPVMLSMPMNMPGMPGMNPGDFMFEMEDFDGINFERDFGQWFTAEEGSGLELK